jgi:flavorubredoxin
MITNQESGTRIDEIASGIYRISTPVPPQGFPGGFSFNQYLVIDDEPLIFHTGPRAMFPLTSQAVAAVMPVEKLRYISFSHVEADESGALNDFLRVAPQAVPLCSLTAALVQIGDLADRPPRPMNDGDTLSLGSRTIRWIAAPHVPHNWETGYLFDESTRTLFCGDLFTQGGHDRAPLTSGDILETTDAFRALEATMGMPPSWSRGRDTSAVFARIASTNPSTLACMHGSAWSGEEGEATKLLLELRDRVTG